MESKFPKVRGYLPWNLVNKHLLNIQIRFNPNSSFLKLLSAPEWWIPMEQHVPSPERLALAYSLGQQVGTGRVLARPHQVDKMWSWVKQKLI